jgi:hypothetical protein
LDSDLKLLLGVADLIVKYGFVGVGVVLIAIAAFIKKLWDRDSLAIPIGIFGVAFVVVAGLLDIVQRYFPWLLWSRSAMVAGVVLGIPNGFQTQVASDIRIAGPAFIKLENDPSNRTLTNFPFVLVASQSPKCLSVAIVNNDPQSETGTSGFKIEPISKDDLKSDSIIVAEAKRVGRDFHLSVWHEVHGVQVDKAVPLSALANDDLGCTVGQSVGFWQWAFSPAFAQSNTAADQDFSLRLTSDDVFTRRNARIDLSKQGAQTVDFARKFLNSDNYRLQLGALVSLSIKPEQEQKQLPPDVLSKVHEFTNNRDSTIRETAQRIESNVSSK